MATTTTQNPWALEVVRGRDVGRHYSLAAGETTIGNAPGTTAHVDLADQEGASPRRMSGRQARLVATSESLIVRDLDSPGGTFVNRRRLLNGQDHALQPGDVIQVGGVQLKVGRKPAETPAPKPTPNPSPSNVLYTFPGGAVCRTWDDFLTLAAQRWALVRDELASGRLTEHLRRAGRAELAPKQEPGKTPDEALDAWLGRLPASRSSAPELDVHPSVLVVRAGSAGGVVRQSLRITNVGYRMLRSTLHVESPAPGRIRLAPERDGKPLLTIDQSDVGVEIEIPEDAAAAATTLGTIVVSSNGGARRIDVRVERPTAAGIPDEAVEPPPGVGAPIGSALASMPLERRFWLFPAVLVGYRFLVGLSGRLPFLATSEPPGLAAPATVTAALGFLIGAAFGSRGGGPLDTAASGFAGLVAGLLASALGFAAIRSVEDFIGPSSSTPTLLVVWGLLGAALAAASWVAFPARKGGGA